MKKIIVGVICLTFITGCYSGSYNSNGATEKVYTYKTTVKLIQPSKTVNENDLFEAKKAGKSSVVGWIKIDNAGTGTISYVSSILEIVSAKAKSVTNDYTESIYPDIEKYIGEQVKVQYRPMCKAGVLYILGELDLYFVMNPAMQRHASSIVESFLDGASDVLDMSETDPILIQARKSAVKRSSELKKK